MTVPFLEVEQLTKDFGGMKAVDRVSFKMASRFDCEVPSDRFEMVPAVFQNVLRFSSLSSLSISPLIALPTLCSRHSIASKYYCTNCRSDIDKISIL
ncbi:hypothetical protein ACFL9T_19520 [Thermodesulfobacteriota bacterium]